MPLQVTTNAQSKWKALAALPFDELKKKAEAGDADAQEELAERHHFGRGVRQDDTEAMKWYRKAAEQGVARAQCWVGLCYEYGHGVSQDYTEAVKWFRKAAEQGEVLSEYNLGYLYTSGSGVARNYTEAAKWYRKAAEQGEVTAQYNLGLSYEYGNGVSQDYIEAGKWYRKAAEQGDSNAQFQLGFCYQTGRGVSQDFTEAVKWYRKAAEQGNADAQFCLGGCYFKGEGAPQIYAEAVKLFRKAAEQGHAFAQCQMGDCYARGQGVPQDYIEAYKWYNLAAAQSLSESYTDATRDRDQLAESMTPEQIAEGQRRASQFVAQHEKGAAVTPKGSGTGFFIADGYVITSYHVVSDASTIKIVMGGNVCKAKLVKADPANDLALLSVYRTVGEAERVLRSTNATAIFSSLPILGSRDVHLGDSVFTLGFPNTDIQGVEPKLTRGDINSLSGIQDDLRFFQISTPVQPGNSGGPLVDMRGNVIGIVEARLSDSVALETSGALPQNVNYALKSSFLIAFLDSVPELASKLKEPHADRDRQLSDVVREVQEATVMVTVY